MTSLILQVDGMTCQGCVSSVTRVLMNVSGVSDAQVSLDTKQARIHYDATKTNHAELRRVIEDAGYDVLESQ